MYLAIYFTPNVTRYNSRDSGNALDILQKENRCLTKRDDKYTHTKHLHAQLRLSFHLPSSPFVIVIDQTGHRKYHGSVKVSGIAKGCHLHENNVNLTSSMEVSPTSTKLPL